MTPSEESIAELRRFIEEESRRWVQKYVNERRDVLRRRKVEATGALINSLQYNVTATLNQAVSNTIELAFDEHGRFRDMKRIDPPSGGTAYIQSLSEWIERKGLYSEFLKNYMSKRGLRNVGPKAQVLSNMAWGIARSRKNGKYKRTAWYAKSSTAAVTDLFNRVAAGLPDIVADEIKQSFNQ